MSDVSFFNAKGEAKEKIKLPDVIEKVSESRYALHEVVVALHGNQRKGTSSTKTRAEVSGGGKKPWKQKGTGNARAGSNRSPLWRKGGITFGPKPRSYYVALPQAKKDQAVAVSIQLKANDNLLAVVESLPSEAKTKAFSQWLSRVSPTQKTLLVVDSKSEGLAKAARNINRLVWMRSNEVNAWEIMKSQQVLFTQQALQEIQKRLSKD